MSSSHTFRLANIVERSSCSCNSSIRQHCRPPRQCTRSLNRSFANIVANIVVVHGGLTIYRSTTDFDPDGTTPPGLPSSSSHRDLPVLLLGKLNPFVSKNLCPTMGQEENCSNPDSHLVSHDSTNESLPCLTLLIGREAVFSWRYGRRYLDALF